MGPIQKIGGHGDIGEAKVSLRFTPGLAAPSTEREIPMQIGFLMGTISKLEDIVSSLRSRLAPCLAPDAPRPGTPTNPIEKQTSTVAGESIATARGRIQRMNVELEDIIGRIEL